MPTSFDLNVIYLGNYADIDPIETGTSEAENASTLLGTFGSDSDRLASRLTTVTAIDNGGTSEIDEDSHSGTDTITYDVGSGPVTTQVDAVVFYNATATYTDGTSESGQVYVFQATDGNVFLLNAPSAQPTNFTTKPIESITFHSVNFDNYINMAPTYHGGEFVCFGPRTRILTPSGEVPVELLHPGCLVETLDHGPRPIIWTGKRHLTFARAPNGQKPIQVKAGSLGEGVPAADLIVSPQHRFFCVSPGGERLAAAKSFAPRQGVRRMTGKRDVTYHTILFDRHEVIFANGLAVESFYPGLYALSRLSAVQRLQVIAQLPGVLEDLEATFGLPARPLLKHSEARDLLSRRQLNVPVGLTTAKPAENLL